MRDEAPAILLFDGVCTLCNGVVQFVVDRDPRGRFVFASLQSEEGRAVLASVGLAPPVEGAQRPERAEPDSVVLVEGGHAYVRSAAVLRAAGRMGWPWRALAAFVIVPAFVRDAVYRFIARHRYRWFGREQACRVPTPALRARLLANRPDLQPRAATPADQSLRTLSS